MDPNDKNVKLQPSASNLASNKAHYRTNLTTFSSSQLNCPTVLQLKL